MFKHGNVDWASPLTHDYESRLRHTWVFPSCLSMVALASSVCHQPCSNKKPRWTEWFGHTTGAVADKIGSGEGNKQRCMKAGRGRERERETSTRTFVV